MATPASGPGYVVRISEPALIQLCQAGLEAYSVRHLRSGPQVGLEVYGLLWGHQNSLPDGSQFLSVEMALPDTSARMDHGSVEPSAKALELKRDLMTRRCHGSTGATAER